MLTEVPSSFKRPDGIWEHHIRQSDLGTFAMCPELHRRSLCGSVLDAEGDAALVGTACHESYAEATRTLLQGKDVEGSLLLDVGMETLTTGWREAELQGNFRNVQIATIDEARQRVMICLALWAEHILPILNANPDLIETVEYRFDVKVYEDDKRVIYLTGTWDLGFNGELLDYKHSGSQKYTKQKAWQLSRYHPQPIHYAWAHDLCMVGDGDTFSSSYDSELAPFHFININYEKGVQWIGPKEGLKVKTVGDARFHLELMKSLALLIEAELPAWPLGPNDWWCSSKWCPAWNDCRGKFIGEDPWSLLEKAKIEMDKRR